METEEYKGYTIAIDYEQDPTNPLEWTTPSERGAWFMLERRGYNLPNETNVSNFDDFDSWTEVAEALKANHVAFNTYKFVEWYEHGNVVVRLSDTEDTSGFDSGIAGVILGEDEQSIENAFIDWKMYIEGDVYTISITNQYGQLVETMGDVFGYDGAMEEARMMVDQAIEHDRPTNHTVTARELHR